MEKGKREKAVKEGGRSLGGLLVCGKEAVRA